MLKFKMTQRFSCKDRIDFGKYAEVLLPQKLYFFTVRYKFNIKMKCTNNKIFLDGAKLYKKVINKNCKNIRQAYGLIEATI